LILSPIEHFEITSKGFFIQDPLAKPAKSNGSGSWLHVAQPALSGRNPADEVVVAWDGVGALQYPDDRRSG